MQGAEAAATWVPPPSQLPSLPSLQTEIFGEQLALRCLPCSIRKPLITSSKETADFGAGLTVGDFAGNSALVGTPVVGFFGSDIS